MNDNGGLTLLLGDCLETMKGLPDNSVDAIVTDPPYGLGFMGKHWDHGVPGVDFWREMFRILKPGAHLAAFSGTRTYHRMAVAIEDAGFQVRDMCAWVYGSGFPKSHDVSKAIDREAGAEREVIGKRQFAVTTSPNFRDDNWEPDLEALSQVTAPATEAAKKWSGWGTALKPAQEPICIARKPLEGTVAQNVQKWGVGGLNIDGCRIEGENPSVKRRNGKAPGKSVGITGWETPARPESYNEQRHGELIGRFPANLILDDESSRLLDKQSSVASRFFYCAKASRAERGEGNTHPTVKPVALMRWLCRLIGPPGGVILDPFMGSGTTGIAARVEGFRFIGCEREPEYMGIARLRIQHWNPADETDPAPDAANDNQKRQLTLFG